MSHDRGVSEPPSILDRTGYELEVEDTFAGPSLDERLWFPHHLAGWSSREASAARYEVGGGLRLRIDADQPPWSPEFDGGTRASSLQTGVFSGPLGSGIGQVHFREGLVVREEQGSVALYTPRYGVFEVRCRAIDDPANMVALWMIGFGDEPTTQQRSALRDLRTRRRGRDGQGRDGRPPVRRSVDRGRIRRRARRHRRARDAHLLGALDQPAMWRSLSTTLWSRSSRHSPAYPMQFMLDIYEFSDGPGLPSPADRYPKVFAVDWFRGYRPVLGPDARLPAFRR